MRKVLLIVCLLNMSACASFMQGFEEGQREGAGFWNGFAQQAAQTPGWGQPSQQQTPEAIQIRRPSKQDCVTKPVYSFGELVRYETECTEQ